jgi:hypothetical protein
MKQFYSSQYFDVGIHTEPHVTRLDGGHIVIVPKRSISERWEFTQEEAVDCMRISMIVGEAMIS